MTTTTTNTTNTMTTTTNIEEHFEKNSIKKGDDDGHGGNGGRSVTRREGPGAAVPVPGAAVPGAAVPGAVPGGRILSSSRIDRDENNNHNDHHKENNDKGGDIYNNNNNKNHNDKNNNNNDKNNSANPSSLEEMDRAAEKLTRYLINPSAIPLSTMTTSQMEDIEAAINYWCQKSNPTNHHATNNNNQNEPNNNDPNNNDNNPIMIMMDGFALDTADRLIRRLTMECASGNRIFDSKYNIKRLALLHTNVLSEWLRMGTSMPGALDRAESYLHRLIRLEQKIMMRPTGTIPSNGYSQMNTSTMESIIPMNALVLLLKLKMRHGDAPSVANLLLHWTDENQKNRGTNTINRIQHNKIQYNNNNQSEHTNTTMPTLNNEHHRIMLSPLFTEALALCAVRHDKPLAFALYERMERLRIHHGWQIPEPDIDVIVNIVQRPSSSDESSTSTSTPLPTFPSNTARTGSSSTIRRSSLSSFRRPQQQQQPPPQPQSTPESDMAGMIRGGRDRQQPQQPIAQQPQQGGMEEHHTGEGGEGEKELSSFEAKVIHRRALEFIRAAGIHDKSKVEELTQSFHPMSPASSTSSSTSSSEWMVALLEYYLRIHDTSEVLQLLRRMERNMTTTTGMGTGGIHDDDQDGKGFFLFLTQDHYESILNLVAGSYLKMAPWRAQELVERMEQLEQQQQQLERQRSNGGGGGGGGGGVVSDGVQNDSPTIRVTTEAYNALCRAWIRSGTRSSSRSSGRHRDDDDNARAASVHAADGGGVVVPNADAVSVVDEDGKNGGLGVGVGVGVGVMRGAEGGGQGVHFIDESLMAQRVISIFRGMVKSRRAHKMPNADTYRYVMQALPQSSSSSSSSGGGDSSTGGQIDPSFQLVMDALDAQCSHDGHDDENKKNNDDDDKKKKKNNNNKTEEGGVEHHRPDDDDAMRLRGRLVEAVLSGLAERFMGREAERVLRRATERGIQPTSEMFLSAMRAVAGPYHHPRGRNVILERRRRRRMRIRRRRQKRRRNHDDGYLDGHDDDGDDDDDDELEEVDVDDGATILSLLHQVQMMGVPLSLEAYEIAIVGLLNTTTGRKSKRRSRSHHLRRSNDDDDDHHHHHHHYHDEEEDPRTTADDDDDEAFRLIFRVLDKIVKKTGTFFASTSSSSSDQSSTQTAKNTKANQTENASIIITTTTTTTTAKDDTTTAAAAAAAKNTSDVPSRGQVSAFLSEILFKLVAEKRMHEAERLLQKLQEHGEYRTFLDISCYNRILKGLLDGGEYRKVQRLSHQLIQSQQRFGRWWWSQQQQQQQQQEQQEGQQQQQQQQQQMGICSPNRATFSMCLQAITRDDDDHHVDFGRQHDDENRRNEGGGDDDDDVENEQDGEKAIMRELRKPRGERAETILDIMKTFRTDDGGESASTSDDGNEDEETTFRPDEGHYNMALLAIQKEEGKQQQHHHHHQQKHPAAFDENNKNETTNDDEYNRNDNEHSNHNHNFNYRSNASAVERSYARFEEMIDLGIRPQPYTFDILMVTVMRRLPNRDGMFPHVMKLRDRMVELGVEPTTHTYRNLLEACSRVRRGSPHADPDADPDATDVAAVLDVATHAMGMLRSAHEADAHHYRLLVRILVRLMPRRDDERRRRLLESTLLFYRADLHGHPMDPELFQLFKRVLHPGGKQLLLAGQRKNTTTTTTMTTDEAVEADFETTATAETTTNPGTVGSSGGDHDEGHHDDDIHDADGDGMSLSSSSLSSLSLLEEEVEEKKKKKKEEDKKKRKDEKKAMQEEEDRFFNENVSSHSIFRES